MTNKKEANNEVDMSSFWTTINSKVVYKTPWIKVIEDDVKDPNGKDYIYSYVEKSDFVSAVVLDENHNIYLVGQYRYPVKEFSWEVVQGGIDNNESPLDAAKREVKEEIGVIAKSYELIFENFLSSASLKTTRGNVFLVRGVLEEGEQHFDPTEKLFVKKVPFKEALKMVCEGKITCVSSCFAILLAAKKLGI